MLSSIACYNISIALSITGGVNITYQTRKSDQEKLAYLTQKIEQLQVRKMELAKKVKADERKRRTKRLIEIGAIVEAYAGEITDLNKLKTYLEKYGDNIRKTQPQKKD